MKFGAEEIQETAAALGLRPNSLEKVFRLLSLLEALRSNAFQQTDALRRSQVSRLRRKGRYVAYIEALPFRLNTFLVNRDIHASMARRGVGVLGALLGLYGLFGR